MELSALVGRAREGDVAAFTALVGRFQHLAFGYALGLVRDFALAEDVAQEAFVAAWASLPKLETPAAFPGWLRGIVGHCAHRVLRRRVLEAVPLDGAEGVCAGTADPAAAAERRERAAAMLAAVEALPAALREVTFLHYVHERSHEQIATFLGLPATTVNNRLHAARAQLKRRLLTMVKDTLHEHRLPEDFPARVGRIVAADGPVVEARFEGAEPPEVHTALALEGGGALHVIQRLRDGRVRGLAAPGLLAGVGARVVGTNEAVSHPLDDATLGQAMRRLRRPLSAPPVLLESGIKVIDLFAPLAAGSAVALLGDLRVGATVVVEELTLRLKDAPGGLTMFQFLPPGTPDPSAWPAARAEGYSGGNSGNVQTFYFLRERLTPGASTLALDAVDAVITLSPAVAAMKIYPCVEPLMTRSGLLDAAVVGAEHATVARRARGALTALAALETRGETTWSDDERRLIGRARKLRQFFSQPFFIAEPYTKLSGSRVSRQDTVRACAGILDGVWDDVPETAFRFAGGIDEVLARARG
ncbi:MAG TPA: sigma-70 family RNA polymerase sigma factor [Methylomirabilota bacterium]|nr:sigma-70 family RNA polymerase sigma factor [Methylomirabilota bacterium]